MHDPDNEWDFGPTDDDSTPQDTGSAEPDNEWFFEEPEAQPEPSAPAPRFGDFAPSYGEPDDPDEEDPRRLMEPVGAGQYTLPGEPDDEGYSDDEYDEGYSDEEYDEDTEVDDKPTLAERWAQVDPEDRKKYGIGAGVLLTVVLVLLVLVRGMGGDDGAGEETTPAPTTSITSSASATSSATSDTDTEEVQPFVDDLLSAMNDRDAEAYFDLMSPAAQKEATLDVAKSAISKLQKGARYSAEISDASVATDTATVQIDLTAKVDDKSTEQKMEIKLTDVDGDWKMELPD